jgi:hypothetical protein
VLIGLQLASVLVVVMLPDDELPPEHPDNSNNTQNGKVQFIYFH